jgi:hypothetical protein
VEADEIWCLVSDGARTRKLLNVRGRGRGIGAEVIEVGGREVRIPPLGSRNWRDRVVSLEVQVGGSAVMRTRLRFHHGRFRL